MNLSPPSKGGFHKFSLIQTTQNFSRAYFYYHLAWSDDFNYWQSNDCFCPHALGLGTHRFSNGISLDWFFLPSTECCDRSVCWGDCRSIEPQAANDAERHGYWFIHICHLTSISHKQPANLASLPNCCHQRCLQSSASSGIRDFDPDACTQTALHSCN